MGNSDKNSVDHTTSSRLFSQNKAEIIKSAIAFGVMTLSSGVATVMLPSVVAGICAAAFGVASAVSVQEYRNLCKSNKTQPE